MIIITKEEGASAAKCPVCGSPRISVQTTSGDDETLWEECQCNECESPFTLVFDLVMVRYEGEEDQDGGT
jgi:formate dehydrogenase maturation protein FdhE